jgi:hypothetical protein
MAKKTTEQEVCSDEEYQPKQKQRSPRKLLVFKSSNQAEKSLVTQDQTDRTPPTTSTNAPEKTSHQSSGKQNEPSSEIHKMFTNLKQKLDSRLLLIENKQAEDRSEMKKMKQDISIISSAVKESNTIISTIEQKLSSSVQQAVQSHMTLFSDEFEKNLNAKLKASAMMLEEKNEERSQLFRNEHQSFVNDFHKAQAEQQQVNDELKSMIRRLIIGQGDNEIVFTDDHNSVKTNDDHNDVSFECYHE